MPLVTNLSLFRRSAADPAFMFHLRWSWHFFLHPLAEFVPGCYPFGVTTTKKPHSSLNVRIFPEFFPKEMSYWLVGQQQNLIH